MCTTMHINRSMKNKQKNTAIKELVEAFDSQLFKALSEPIRVEILKFLLLEGKSDVATVSENINKDRSVLSRHLHQLSEAGLLKHEKISRNSFFEIDAMRFRSKIHTLFEKVEKAIGSCC